MVNIQDIILNRLRKDRIPCAVHLTNGYQIKGALVVGFDNFAILLAMEGEKQMLLYKHAVSSITPSVPIPWDPPKGE